MLREAVRQDFAKMYINCNLPLGFYQQKIVAMFPIDKEITALVIVLSSYRHCLSFGILGCL